MLKEFRARTLQKYVLREYLISFGLTLSVTFLLCGIVILIFKAEDFSKFGISMGKALLMMPYLMPKPLALAIPPAAMIAAIMVFGRLSAENEVLAIQSGGAPLRTVVLPLILVAVLLSLFCLFCNQWAMRYGIDLLRNEIFRVNKEDFFTQLEKPGNTVALPLEDNSVLRINWLPWTKTNPETGKPIRPLHMVMFKNQQIEFSMFAEDYTANFPETGKDKRVMLLTVRNAQLFRDPPGFLGETTVEFVLPSPASLIDVGGERGDRGWLDNWQLAKSIRESFPLRRKFQLQRAAELGGSMISTSPGDPSSALIVADNWTLARGSSEAIHGTGGARERARFEQAEAYTKIAMSVLPISMVVLGMGLGLLVQKRQRLVGFIVGMLVLALVYYPMSIICRELARADRVENWILFLPNILLLVSGYLVWRWYERGVQFSLPIGSLGVQAALKRGMSSSVETTLSILRAVGTAFVKLTPFGRRKTDELVAGSFIGVLMGVLLCIGTIIVGIDLIENGSQVINGIVKAGEPLPGLPARTEVQAILDAGSFYAIRTLETLISLLPVLVMLAALLAVNAMVRNNEHLILKSSGISLQRAFAPIIWIAVIISAGTFAVRETLLPKLILARDSLRPQVYHRQPAPLALALHTRDAKGNPVLFEMSEYSTHQKIGRNLRIHEMREGQRFPSIVANKAEWTGSSWKLSSEVVSEVRKKGAGSSDKKILETKHLSHGRLIVTQTLDAQSNPFSQQSFAETRKNDTPIPEWSGAVTPILLDSDRVGPNVMRLHELQETASVKPAFEVEWWKRVSEWVMTLVLLWLCIPLIVSETWSVFKAVGVIIGVAGMYWILNLGVAEAAQMNYLPVFAPLVMHSVLVLAGLGIFYRRMAT